MLRRGRGARRTLLAVALACLAGAPYGCSDQHGVLAPVAHALSAIPSRTATLHRSHLPGSRRAPKSPPTASDRGLKPRIVPRPIPFGVQRRKEMAAYARRHYGMDTYRLVDPRVIVEHYTETPTAQVAYDIFAVDRPDVELHELPGTCAHFLVDTDGTILQLVPTTVMCRHTVGLNWTAIGIENVGMSDGQVLADSAELNASLALTRWLRCRYHIAVRNVIGHSESLTSPYHHEAVPGLRSQTHSDMQATTMDRYRSLLAAQGC